MAFSWGCGVGRRSTTAAHRRVRPPVSVRGGDGAGAAAEGGHRGAVLGGDGDVIDGRAAGGGDQAALGDEGLPGAGGREEVDVHAGGHGEGGAVRGGVVAGQREARVREREDGAAVGQAEAVVLVLGERHPDARVVLLGGLEGDAEPPCHAVLREHGVVGGLGHGRASLPARARRRGGAENY